MKKKCNNASHALGMPYSLSKLIRIMKIYSLILILTIVKISASSYTGYSQNIVLDYHNTELKTILKALEDQTDYNFFYNNQFVNEEVKVDVVIASNNLKKVLNTFLTQSHIKYKIINKNIVLYKNNPNEASGLLSGIKKGDSLNYSNTGNVFSQFKQDQFTITGKVVDGRKIPLPGVNIIVQGTHKGTQTDFDGMFAIKVSKGDVLEFSFLGMKKQTIPVDESQTKLDIVLMPDAGQLNEVIVVAYDRQSKASYTGAAVQVDIDKVEDAPLASFQESLQGNVAGLQMSTQSGQPGSAPDIRIRGIGSIQASSNPLYVIDGIPVVSGNIARLGTNSNTIAGLNPNDIASITVLKDASATSIYGSRGANGVILITTKKGKEGKTVFDISVQQGISNMILPDRIKPLNSEEHIELLVESRINTGESRTEAEAYIFDRIDPSIDTDWVDVISRQGQYQQYNVSASGGSEKTKFYTSVGYYEQEAVINGIDYEKFNAKINLNHQATDKLSIDLGVGLSHQILHSNSDGGSANNPVRAMFRTVPWEPVFNEDGSYNTSILLTYNPVGLVEENIRETKLYGVLGNLSLKYDFTKNLSFETRGNLDFNLADEFRYDNPDFGEGRNDGGRGRSFDSKIQNYNITNLLKYHWDINEDHTLDFILGQEAQKIDESSVFAYASNYGAPGLITLDNASVYREASSTKTASSISSYFFNTSYAISRKYFFNITARRDGSSRFGSNVRYANFGSAGFAWNITKEKFLEDSDIIKNLKFRTSYGINGNQEIGDFASRGLYATGADYNGEPGYVYSQQVNNGLTWEKNRPFNMGFDFNFINRITGTIEYYNRTTTDLLFRVPISSTNGLTTYLDNIGEMKNSGIELVLNTVNFDNEDGFSWFTNFNFTSNSNEITKLKDDEAIVDNIYIREVGDDFYTFYMPGFAGADPENGDALWYTDESETQTTTEYSEAEPYKQGSALPDLYAGLTNTFTYKNFNFSFLLYLNYGNKVYDYWGRYTNSDGSARLNDRGNMTRNIYENRWQQPGDITDVPKVVYGNTQSGKSSQHSTRFLYDGSYVRLRDVSFGYSFPESLANKLSLSKFRIYLKGNNLLTWVKDKGIELDPEVGIDGQSDLRIPISRQFLIGLDISL